MMNAIEFCALLKEKRFDFFTGVPCAILSKIITCLSAGTEFLYVSATREDEAIGIATGAYMAGKRPVVLMQNSGLGQSINALASLALLYRIPMLLIISWRGYQGKDEPEHFYMGKYTLDLLNIMEIPTEILEKDIVELQLARILQTMDEQKSPVAIILKKDLIN
jgi:sulfopyruvate decarboxylase subunit alpha